MKKALVLGVLAFFAINIASVQSASAQDRKETTTVKKEAKPSGVKRKLNRQLKPLQLPPLPQQLKRRP